MYTHTRLTVADTIDSYGVVRKLQHVDNSVEAMCMQGTQVFGLHSSSANLTRFLNASGLKQH